MSNKEPHATDEEIDKLLRDTIKSLVEVHPNATLNNVAAIFFHIAFEAAIENKPVKMTKIVVMGGELLEDGAEKILAEMAKVKATQKGKRPKWRS